MKTVLAAAVLAITAASAGADPATAPRGQHETTPAKTAAAVGTSLAFQDWIGRSVESSDGQSLGEVSGLNEDDQNEFYVDLGGFLALGATRVRVSSDEVREVKDDRIVLRLTEAEARNLPPADSVEGQQL